MPKQHPNGAASEDNSPVVFSVTEKQLTEILLRMQRDIREIKRIATRAAGKFSPSAKDAEADAHAKTPAARN